MEISNANKATLTSPSHTERRPENVAFVGLLLQLVLLLFSFAVYVYIGNSKELSFRGASSLFGELLHLAPGVIIWLLCYLRLRFTRLAQEEEQELNRLNRFDETSTSIFEDSSTPDAYTAKGRLARLERLFFPAVTVIVASMMLLTAVLILGGWIRLHSVVVTDHLAISSAFLVAFAFAAFVFSQYVIGLSAEPEYRFLRPGGAFLLSNSFFLALCAIGLVLYQAKLLTPEKILTKAIPFLLGILGLEYITNFILDFFRPRLPGQELRSAYDSRLFGLFAQPGSLWKAMADTLDYQFGFRVSKTWFYGFIGRLIVPLVAIQVTTAVLLTCLVVVEHDQVVLVERFGKPCSELLKPGFHIKLPWPISKAYPIPVGKIQRVTVGFSGHDEEEGEGVKSKQESHSHGHSAPKKKLPKNVDVWTDSSHSHGDFILVASRKMDSDMASFLEQEVETSHDYHFKEHDDHRHEGEKSDDEWDKSQRAYKEKMSVKEIVERDVPVNMISVSVVVHYRILEEVSELFNYVYLNSDPAHYLENIAHRELVRIASSVDLHEMMGPGRLELNSKLRENIVKEVSKAKLGIRIEYVGILELHPPAPIAHSFEAVFEVREESQAKIVNAKAYADTTFPKAMTKGNTLIYEADAYRFQRVELSRAEVDSFSDRLQAYRSSPEIYRLRYFLSTLEEALQGKRKYILSPDIGYEEILLKFEDKIKADFLNIGLE